jgi:hypothetical protein
VGFTAALLLDLRSAMGCTMKTQDQDPMDDQNRATWLDYAQRKRAERLAEADAVWRALEAAGGNAETVLAVDFVHFGPTQAHVNGLREQLSENYTVATEQGPQGYWLLKGTTRPYGITLSPADHLAWVGFLCDVAESHGCVLSTWSLTAPALSLTVSSEAFDVGS